MRLKDFSNALERLPHADRQLFPLWNDQRNALPSTRWTLVRRLRQRALISAMLLCLCALGSAQAQQLIVNDDVGISAIDRNRARLIFTMRVNQWSDQLPVAVFVLPDDAPLHQAFAKSALGVFPHQLRQTWDRQVFSGTGQAPLQVASESEMLRRVRQTPGAIGYVSQSSNTTGIKVIEVE